ncbi:MAG TPA: hypothetical protein VKU84_05985, partial [Stellaceae bacterium]|nr:hypothetical protein [Stellaceae bacterium]
ERREERERNPLQSFHRHPPIPAPCTVMRGLGPRIHEFFGTFRVDARDKPTAVRFSEMGCASIVRRLQRVVIRGPGPSTNFLIAGAKKKSRGWPEQVRP